MTQGKFTKVDHQDFDWISQHKWSFDGAYAARRENGKKIYMHRLVCGTPKDKETDHINGDKLDNRRLNLRVCDRSLNTLNRGIRLDSVSGFKGVSFHKVRKKWRAYFCGNHLGLFSTKEKAAKAYNNFALGRGYKIKLNTI